MSNCSPFPVHGQYVPPPQVDPRNYQFLPAPQFHQDNMGNLDDQGPCNQGHGEPRRVNVPQQLPEIHVQPNIPQVK